MSSIHSCTRAGAVVLVAVLLATVCVAGAGAQAGQATDAPTVSVTNVSVDAGNATTAQIRLSSAPNGLAGYAIEVSTADGTVATVTDATVEDTFGFDNVTVGDGTATLVASDTNGSVESGATDVRLGSVTVEGVSAGETSLTVDLVQVDADGGAKIDAATASGTATVEGETGEVAGPVVEISNVTTDAGASESAALRLSAAPNGLAGYAIEVSTADGTVATVTDATVEDTFGFDNVTVGDGTATLVASDTNGSVESGATDVRLGSVTVEGAGEGETSLTVELVQIDADGGAKIDAVASGGTVTVEGTNESPRPTVPGANGPASDPDGDGRLEDVDGNGDANLFDALTYYNNRDSGVITDNPTLFDFDGDGESGSLFDALALYNDLG